MPCSNAVPPVPAFSSVSQRRPASRGRTRRAPSLPSAHAGMPRRIPTAAWPFPRRRDAGWPWPARAGGPQGEPRSREVAGVRAVTEPAPDRAELARFVGALFRHAERGRHVSLRAFFDDNLAKRRNEPPFRIRNVRLNGGGLAPVVEAAFKLAAEALRPAAGRGRPIPATFNPGKAEEANLFEGLVLLVDVDQANPAAALATLRQILGSRRSSLRAAAPGRTRRRAKYSPGCTSTGCWWSRRRPRRSTPSSSAPATSRASWSAPTPPPRRSATRSGWPGSVHRKDPDNPKLCRIVEEEPGRQDRSRGRAGRAGGHRDPARAGRGLRRRRRPGRGSGDPTGDADLLRGLRRTHPERGPGLVGLEPDRDGVLARQRRERGRLRGVRPALA